MHTIVAISVYLEALPRNDNALCHFGPYKLGDERLECKRHSEMSPVLQSRHRDARVDTFAERVAHNLA